MLRSAKSYRALVLALGIVMLHTWTGCGSQGIDADSELGGEEPLSNAEDDLDDAGVPVTEKQLPLGSLQAEGFTAQSGCSKATNRAGYTGTAFVDYGGNGTWIEWNNVAVPSAGTYRLTFRYAAQSARRSTAIVNGTNRGNVAFASTGSWTTWATDSIAVPLRAGNNTIRVVANTDTGGPNLDSMAFACGDATTCPRARSLYTYDFGGLERKTPSESVALLMKLGYVGIVPSGRTATDRARLLQYYDIARTKGDAFRVFAVMMPHRFHSSSEGLRMNDHKAAIDMMAGRGGQLWLWFRDQASGYSSQAIRDFIRGVVQYANNKRVEIVLYPHVDNIYPDAAAGFALVKELNAMGLRIGLAVNLTHELQAGKGGIVKQTFENTKQHTVAVTLSGSNGQSPFVASLDESVYDTRPYMEGIRDTGFRGPVGYLNWRLENPESHLERTMREWQRLCMQVGLYDP